MCVCLCGRKCAFFFFLLFCHGLIICETCHLKGFFFFFFKFFFFERLKFVVVVT